VGNESKFIPRMFFIFIIDAFQFFVLWLAGHETPRNMDLFHFTRGVLQVTQQSVISPETNPNLSLADDLILAAPGLLV
jgi:hypothetical protein